MKSEMVVVKNADIAVDTYLSAPVAPEASSKVPTIIVIHEIWGLNDQIKSVADRFAVELGFLALVPDLMKGELLEAIDPGIYRDMSDPAKRDEAQKKMREVTAPINKPEFAVRAVAKLKACFEFLKNHEKSNGAVGVVGFCFGGTYAFALAGAEPDLKFSIPFYGHPPADDVVAKINCPVLAFYGDQDERLMTTLPELTATMQKHGKNFKGIVYPGTGHAFFNEKNPMRYDAEAAAKAWEEIKKFLTANNLHSA